MFEEMLHVGGALSLAALWPAVAALVVVAALGLVWPRQRGAAWQFAVAFGVAYATAHAVGAGEEWSLVPVRTWHWLFYLVLAACLAGVINNSGVRTTLGNCGVVAVVALLCAGLLTNRSSLAAPRPVIVAAMFGYLVSLWAGLQPLCRPGGRSILPLMFSLAAGGLAAMVAEQINITHGQVLSSAAGCFLGLAIYALVCRSVQAAAGLALPFVIAIGGWAWLEFLSESRLWPLLIVPAAPLVLWTAQQGPLARLTGRTAFAVEFALVLSVVAAVGAYLHFAGGLVY